MDVRRNQTQRLVLADLEVQLPLLLRDLSLLVLLLVITVIIVSVLRQLLLPKVLCRRVVRFFVSGERLKQNHH